MDGEFVPCDSCGQRSFAWATLPSGRDLSYCGHHYRQYAEALTNMGAITYDLTHMVS